MSVIWAIAYWGGIVLFSIVAAWAVLMAGEYLACLYWARTRCKKCGVRYGFEERQWGDFWNHHVTFGRMHTGLRCPHCHRVTFHWKVQSWR